MINTISQNPSMQVQIAQQVDNSPELYRVLCGETRQSVCDAVFVQTGRVISPNDLDRWNPHILGRELEPCEIIWIERPPFEDVFVSEPEPEQKSSSHKIVYDINKYRRIPGEVIPKEAENQQIRQQIINEKIYGVEYSDEFMEDPEPTPQPKPPERPPELLNPQDICDCET